LNHQLCYNGIGGAIDRGFGQDSPGIGTGRTGISGSFYRELRHENRRNLPENDVIAERNIKLCK